MVAVISFWDSSSSRTELEYWPLELGVAGRKEDEGLLSSGYGFRYGDDEVWGFELEE